MSSRSALAGLALCAAIAFSTACGSVFAGEGALPVTDYSITVELDPEQDLYPPESSALIRLTVENQGPDDSPGARINLPPFAYEGLNSQVVVFGNAQTPPCSINYNHLDAIPGFHGYFIPAIYTPPIAAGAALECVLQVDVLETGRGAYLLRAGVGGIAIVGQESVDPDESDNLDEVLVQITPPDAPPPETNLIAELIPVDPQPLYPPGSDFNVELRVHNAGPDDAGGATFDWNLDHLGADSPIALNSRLADEGGHGICRRTIGTAETPPGVGMVQSRFPGMHAGDTVSCFVRVRVHPGATGHFQIGGVLTTEPDFGDPTFDPDLSSNSPSFGGAITFPIATPQPAVVPGPGLAALLSLGLLTALSAAVLLIRQRRI